MHQIEKESYSYKTNKKDIAGQINNYVSREGDAGTLYEPIQWHENTKFNSYEEADKWITEHDHSYANIAVTYYAHNKPSQEKLAKYNELSKRANELQKAVSSLKDTNYFANHKSAFISCPQCGSKLNLKKYNEHKWYGRSNYCPLCQESMLKETQLKKIAAAENKAKLASEKAREEYKKQENKTPKELRWLIKYEFHC